MSKKKKNTTSRKTALGAPPNGRKPQPKFGYPLSLTVQNLRCFGAEPQTLDLSDGSGRPARWTLLLGNNGTGKTTLLEAFASICEGPSFGLPDGQEIIRPAAFSWRGEWPSRAAWRPFRQPAQEYTIACSVCTNWRFTSMTRRPEHVSLELAIKPSSGQFSTTGDKVLPRCYGYGTTRRPGGTTVTESETPDPCASLFSEDANLRNAEEWLLRLDYSGAKESEIQVRQKELLFKIKAALCDLLPNVESIRINTPTKAMPTPSVEFETPYGWVGLANLGQGYRSLIAWVVDFAGRMFDAHPNKENPLAEPAVVLIDEIDLHLHPKWQRRVMDHLSKRFVNTQFIATAHSPLIAQAADNANVALLQREGDHVVIRNNMKPMRGARLDQVVTSELYGLETARPLHLKKSIQRRRELLTKSRLTDKDKRELKRLEADLGSLPAGETAAEAKALQDIVNQTQALLEKYEG